VGDQDGLEVTAIKTIAPPRRGSAASCG
jgi:hypothetical protein